MDRIGFESNQNILCILSIHVDNKVWLRFK